MTAMKLSKLQTYNFEQLFKKKGYAYFTNGAYNLNIIGIRTKGTKVTNLFDDYIVVIYKTAKGNEVRNIYRATTDPGTYFMKSPMNDNGTAIIVPGQYRGAYQIGLHKGKYKALCQRKPIKVYRDKNKDMIYDFEPKTIQEGIFGCNIHKAGAASKYVNNWSAGCQVIAAYNDFQNLMYLANKQIEHGHGKTFTYTLLKEEDLV